MKLTEKVPQELLFQDLRTLLKVNVPQIAFSIILLLLLLSSSQIIAPQISSSGGKGEEQCMESDHIGRSGHRLGVLRVLSPFNKYPLINMIFPQNTSLLIIKLYYSPSCFNI